MVQQLYDVLLHKLTKHTNVSMPFCKYISGNVFPTQIPELLNTDITLKYRNHYLVDNSDLPCIGRPSDDTEYRPKSYDGPEFNGDQNDVYSGTFTVIRADSSEPFRLIAVSKDYKKILINSTKVKDGAYEFLTKISEYSVQDNMFFGLDVRDQYAGELNELKAVSVRVDEGEPCYSVMLEFLGATNYIRFILGDEAFTAINTYLDLDEQFDYNNATAKEEDNYLDADGYYADWRDVTDSLNIDGGYAGNVYSELQDRRAGQQFFDINRYDFIDEEDWWWQHRDEAMENLDFEDEDEWWEAHRVPEDEEHDFIDEDVYYIENTNFKFKNYNFYSTDKDIDPDDETNKTTPPTSEDDEDDGEYDFGDVEEGESIDLDLKDDDEYYESVRDIGWENYNFANIDSDEEPMDTAYKVTPPTEEDEEDDDGIYDYGDLDEGDIPDGLPLDIPAEYEDLRPELYDDAYDMKNNNPLEERPVYDFDQGGINFGDVDLGDETAEGEFNFGDEDHTDPDVETDSGIYGTAVGDYDMELNAPEERPPIDEDEGKYNFGDIQEGDETAEGDYDMNLNPPSERRPEEPDEGVFNFDDLDGEPGTATGDFDMELNPPSERHPYEPDDGIYNFGDIDLMDATAKGNYDFGDLEEGVEPDSEINFFRMDPLVEITEDDRAALLKRLMEGKVIYGSV